jgi:hypothetical protein
LEPPSLDFRTGPPKKALKSSESLVVSIFAQLKIEELRNELRGSGSENDTKYGSTNRKPD